MGSWVTVLGFRLFVRIRASFKICFLVQCVANHANVFLPKFVSMELTNTSGAGKPR